MALLCVSGHAFAQTPDDLHAALPVIDGWTISPDFEVFNRDNLYERINGAAPLFLENNFQEMTSMVYTQGSDEITIQAYRHTTPEDAFGMYASERSSEMAFYPGIGGEAQGDGYGLFFFAGCVYVKMSVSNDGTDITDMFKVIAKELADGIAAEADYPAIFQLFPKDGLVPYSQSYVTQNYIGHEFLKPVYTADYTLPDDELQLFVVDGGTTKGAQKILNDYLTFTKQTEDAVSEGDNLFVTDRYNGDIPIVWRGQYLIGAFHDDGADFLDDIYDFLSLFNADDVVE
ncbi:hypothetical protein SAMD00024442_110_4 [Candidatus Symbiothrix dinenymphae]|nr:hypothetical protein SAMD00024442_110_4 [Candidatus Symbiothrix dinenymphae]